MTTMLQHNAASAQNTSDDIMAATGRAQGAAAGKEDTAHFHHRLGILLHKSGDQNRAIAAQKRAIALDPTLPGPHFQLGVLYHESGQIPAAIAKVSDAIARKEDAAHFHHLLGILLHKSGDRNRAIAAQKRAIALDPTLPGPHFQLGVLYHESGQIPAAIAKVSDAIARKEDAAHFHHLLGILLHKSGDQNGAIAAQKRAIALDPTLPGPHFQLSLLYQHLQKIALAIRKVRDAIAMKRNNPYFYQHLGILLHKTGNLKEAQDALKRAIALAPFLPDSHFQLSHLYYDSGKIAEAIPKIRDAIAIKGDSPHFHLHLMTLLISYGDICGAQVALEKANTICPSLYRKQTNEFTLKCLIKDGSVAIIPAGFRCFTKDLISKVLKIKQSSLPFDLGFYPPDSIASILRNPTIDMLHDDYFTNYSVCIKYEGNSDPVHGHGIRFDTSSYAEIDQLAADKNQADINKYLDATFGYYTYDPRHQFVLAHYNWHKFANPSKSKGVYDHATNIATINKTLNRRIERMFDMCCQAKYIFFITSETQSYKYMKVDDLLFDLCDFTPITNALAATFSAQTFLVNIKDMSGADTLIHLIEGCEKT